MFSRQEGAYAPNFNLNLNNKCQFQLNNYPNIDQRKPVGVFWDIENCCIPRGLNTFILINKIRALFQKFNLVEREFVVVCDVYGMNHVTINELNNMQVNIVHVCSYSKNASDEKLKQLIYRFSMVHGSYSAIILLSSDINFAPLLSDIKNRIGIFVILFHHRQVSPALLACSNYKIDFDYFCSDVPFHSPEAISFTYLTISNWPKEFNEENVGAFLNRITANSGGRVIEVDHRNCEAMVGFKCKTDAQRCIQRVNSRKIHGYSLKAYINLNPVYSKNDYLKITKAPTNLIQDSATQSNIPKLRFLLPSEKNDPIITESKNAVSSLLETIKVNQCDMCSVNSNKRSQHANFMFKSKILSIHISLSELREKLHRLLEIHSGTLLLNCLPDCWLIEFGQEMNTVTEPKVMLEHLVSCIDSVSIEKLETEVNGKMIITKCIRWANTSNKTKPNLSRRKTRRLNVLSQKIYSILICTLPNKITSFPSILLKDLESTYQRKYNQSLSLEQYRVENIVELVSKLDSKFNLYTYDDDYLLALNFNEQLFCFSSDISKALNSITHEMRSELNVEDMPQLFRKYFDFDLNIAVYGVCYLEDMIHSLIKNSNFKISNENNLIITTQNNLVSSTRVAKTLNIKKLNKKKWNSIMIDLLKTFPNFCIRLSDLFSYLANEEFKNGKLQYSQFVEDVNSLNSNELQILTDEDTYLITLSPKLRLIELGKRFLEIFNDLCLLDHKRPFISQSQSIYQIYFNYVVQFKIRHFYFGLYGTTSLSILFEKILAQFLKSQLENQFCLIYTEKGVYLQKFDFICLEEYLLHLFIVLLQNTSYSLDVKNFKNTFQQTYGYHFGISLTYHHTFKQYFNVIKQTDGNCFIKLTPLYEFIAQCLTVMIMHPNTVISGFEIIQNEEWTLSRLQTTYNFHFGVEMPKPETFNLKNYKELFEQVACVFKAESANSEIVIHFKREDLVKYVDNKSFQTCNFCQKNKLSILNIDTTTFCEIDGNDPNTSPISTNEISQSESCSPLLII